MNKQNQASLNSDAHLKIILNTSCFLFLYKVSVSSILFNELEYQSRLTHQIKNRTTLPRVRQIHRGKPLHLLQLRFSSTQTLGKLQTNHRKKPNWFLIHAAVCQQTQLRG